MLIDPKGEEKSHWKTWTRAQKIGIALLIVSVLGALFLIGGCEC